MALIPSITTPLTCVDIVCFGANTPHGFVLPQSTQQWGKRPLHIQGSPLLIMTSPCASLGDVGFHELQDPLLGRYKLFGIDWVMLGSVADLLFC